MKRVCSIFSQLLQVFPRVQFERAVKDHKAPWVAGQGGRTKFRFKNKLRSLDGSVIDLSVSLFDWAKFRRTKGAIGPRRLPALVRSGDRGQAE